MARLMSVAFTEDAVRNRTKTVTRRKGWQFVKPGDRLTLCRKVMGRKKGEPLVRIVDVQVVSVSRHRLGSLLLSSAAYREMELEGFPGMPPDTFLDRFFLKAQGMSIDDEVTRIEWRYLDTREDACLRAAGCDGRSHSLACNNAWFGRSA